MRLLLLAVVLILVSAPPPAAPAGPPAVLINEIDADQEGTDSQEFVELYDGGVGGTDLAGLVLVFYNGNFDTSYAAFDLDGHTTDANGYFVLGNSGVAPAPAITFNDNTLQNGADAVALYQAGSAGFPAGTPVTTTNLLDAIVYGTGDAADDGLLPLLNPGQPQVNEAGGGVPTLHALQRCPNGSGGARSTSTYVTATPSPGAANPCFVADTIMAVQGAGHLSPVAGRRVGGLPGIVTAAAPAGFYVQDANGDGDPATSDGVFVFTASAPSVALGDSVIITGTVFEFYGGGPGAGNLSVTEIIEPQVVTLSGGHALPPPVVIGQAGRPPPTEVIDDDASGPVESTGAYEPAADGIDFYESLEGMRVQVNNPVAVGPRSVFGEIPVLADDGANAGLRAARGGLVIRPGDFNPERLILDDALQTTPAVNVGDHFDGPAVGVLDYAFGNFKLLLTAPLAAVPGGLAPETTAPAAENELALATLNVQNLDPGDSAAHFDRLAALIVDNLQSPDLLALEEVQDNSGPANDTITAADATYQKLIDAISGAGGPPYQFRQIDPLDGADGGQPGGNIRVGFLFRADRGLAFVDRPGGTATAAVGVAGSGPTTHLSFSPGRIDPNNPAFANSRKPLVGEFTYAGRTLFVVAVHFNSKGGDQPLFGRFQPPALHSEPTRLLQAQAVNAFVGDLLAADPNAHIVVLGDVNDFEFSAPVAALAGASLHVLAETLPPAERYTYLFDGNAQTLDHILLSDALFHRPLVVDLVHANAEFADRATDHDPALVRISFAARLFLPLVVR